MEDGYAKYGDVFTVPVAHKRVTFIIGPDASPHFFKALDDEMSQTEVYNFNVPTFGKGVVYDVDQRTRTEQFRFFTEALKKERLRKYVPMFAAEAEEYFAAWGDSGVVDLKDEFSKLVALTAARTLLGREIREQLFDQVADLLHDLDDGMRPISVFFPYLPTSYHKKRDLCVCCFFVLFVCFCCGCWCVLREGSEETRGWRTKNLTPALQTQNNNKNKKQKN